MGAEFLKNLPCRNPSNFSKLHSPSARPQRDPQQQRTRLQVDVPKRENEKKIIHDKTPALIRYLEKYHCAQRLGDAESRGGKREKPSGSEEDRPGPSFTKSRRL